MLVLGLTGSIGMGKTTTAKIFKQLGVPVHDSDAAVHALMGEGGPAVNIIGKYFKHTREGNRINRYKLAEEVFSNEHSLAVLENILHPLVRHDCESFIETARKAGAKMVLLDIPLLFEKGRHHSVDVTITVTAPANQQRQRVLRRSGMTAARFYSIKGRQYSDYDKRQMADYVIQTGLGLAHTRKIVKDVIDELTLALDNLP